MMSEPLFAKCRHYTYDPYWQEIFDNCSKNKFPRGVSYHKKRRVLYVRVGAKSEAYPLPATVPDIFTAMITIFREKVGLQSASDQAQTKRDIECLASESAVDLDGDWKNIPRYLREEFLSNFVAKIARKHQLALKDAQALYAYVIIQQQLKTIQPGDIVYKNREIKEIKTVSFDAAAGRFVIERAPKSAPKLRGDQGKPRDRFMKLAEGFVKDLNSKTKLTKTPAAADKPSSKPSFEKPR